MDLDGNHEFKVLECEGEARIGQRGCFFVPSKIYRYDQGVISFPSLKRMEVYTHSNDRTRIMLASMGRIMAAVRVSDDDGVSMSVCERFDWPEDTIPNVNRQELRGERRLPVALVVQIPDFCQGTIRCDRGTNRYRTNQGKFIVKTENREPVIVLPERFDRRQRPDLRQQLTPVAQRRAAQLPEMNTQQAMVPLDVRQKQPTHTHAYASLVERFKREADRYMYAVTTVDRALAKREMESLRGQMEFEAMAMLIKPEDRFDEASYMSLYEIDPEKVALVKMRRGSALEKECQALVGPEQEVKQQTHDTLMVESANSNPIAGPSTRRDEQPAALPPMDKTSALKGYIIPKKKIDDTATTTSVITEMETVPATPQLPQVPTLFTNEQMAALKQEMGNFMREMMRECVPQPAREQGGEKWPQLKKEPGSDVEFVSEAPSLEISMDMAEPRPTVQLHSMNSGEIVCSTPDDRSEGELVIDVDPNDILEPELVESSDEG